MSYDLFFYQSKGANLSDREIADYLNTHLVPVNESGNQWLFENKETEVYYSFEKNQPVDESEEEDLPESFADFDDTSFSFNLNFMRPCFFGLEAFQFVDRILRDLNLFVLNPQSSSEQPYRPTKEELY